MNTSASAPPTRRERVLIVDDLSVNRATLRAMLLRESSLIEIEAADDASSAIRALAKSDYDLVLLDVNLGEHGNGLQVLRVIRSEPRFAHTPVLMVTAREPDDDFIAQSLREGADDYVSRPVDPRVLAARVANARRIRDRFVSLTSDVVAAHATAAESRDELRSAAQLQRAALPQVPVRSLNVVASAAVLAVSEVSGDAFDVIQSPSGCTSMVVIDVTGHGNAAGIVASAVGAAIRQGLMFDLPLADVLASVESQILVSRHDGGLPVAASIVRLNPTSNKLEIANAGMPHILLGFEGVDPLCFSSTAPPIGLLAGRLPRIERIAIHEPAMLMLASDGLSGPMGNVDGVGDLWTTIQSHHCAKQLCAAEAPLMQAYIREHLLSYGVPPKDDATVLLACLTPTNARRYQ